MDFDKKKILDAQIRKEQYRSDAIAATIKKLEEQGYTITGHLGIGTYGAVVEISEYMFGTNLAAKIILQEKVTENEIKIWPELFHENILSLNSVNRVPEAGTFVFFYGKA